jgi:hypothetical protein
MPILKNEPDPYNHVPHQGKHFTEEGKSFYWNFADVKPGTRYKSKAEAWVQTGQIVHNVGTESERHPLFPNALPVVPVMIHIPGFYYEIDSDVTAVANAVTPEGVITKWRVDSAVSGAEQTIMAWNCKSTVEYEAAKAALIASRS